MDTDVCGGWGQGGRLCSLVASLSLAPEPPSPSVTLHSAPLSLSRRVLRTTRSTTTTVDGRPPLPAPLPPGSHRSHHLVHPTTNVSAPRLSSLVFLGSRAPPCTRDTLHGYACSSYDSLLGSRCKTRTSRLAWLTSPPFLSGCSREGSRVFAAYHGYGASPPVSTPPPHHHHHHHHHHCCRCRRRRPPPLKPRHLPPDENLSSRST